MMTLGISITFSSNTFNVGVEREETHISWENDNFNDQFS